MAGRPSTRTQGAKQVEALTHDTDTRTNIPTAELRSVAQRLEEARPVAPVHFPRQTPLPEGETRDRDPDLDPQIVWRGGKLRLTSDQIRQLTETGEVEIGDAQLVWRGKDRQDWSDLVVHAPPLYIQEKVHPKAIVDDLRRRAKANEAAQDEVPDLFADFNGLADPDARTEFYEHDQHWTNRLILGDSLHVMASLAEREGMRGKVQCIYFDPPYGIKFNSNWQVSTQAAKVQDGKLTEITREPEQVKAFRDTWKDGIHSYLTYLRDRLVTSRELLSPSGSIFIQIGDENVHRVRALMDEVFGSDNYVSEITFQKTGGQTSDYLPAIQDYVLWYARDIDQLKFRRIYRRKELGVGHGSGARYDQVDEFGRSFQLTSLTSNRPPGSFPVTYNGRQFGPSGGYWKTGESGFAKLLKAGRVRLAGRTLRYVRFIDDFAAYPVTNIWTDVAGSPSKIYVVQTSPAVVERCILMATDPGDLVIDPTCGSGTTATVAEQWGRRWITIDTSRVALALARTRLMSARYPAYLLADSPEGRRKEAEVSGKLQPDGPTRRDLRQGFIYERAPRVTLKSIANNAAIDTIWETWAQTLDPLRAELNAALGQNWEEWQIPREVASGWPESGKRAHATWWAARDARQKEIDASIANAAEVELLYDRPYEDKGKVRVAGPFTVESLSPHRAISSAEEELTDANEGQDSRRNRSKLSTPPTDFADMVLDHLRTAGIHQAEKRDTIAFTALTPWPGSYIGAEGRFLEGEVERRAGILIGPEFGTLTRPDLVAAAREATEARFDVLIACAFNFDAHASELTKLGPLPILKAKMNPDLHMAEDLKNTGKGNLFVVFGEPDIDIMTLGDGCLQVRVNGVDVFDPNTGDIRSSDTAGIAAWFIDTDYNEESFFVRHAYFLGAQDPYKSLKTALKAEIDEEAWQTLYRDTSRPFARPSTGRIAVKVINHFGDEVMKIFPA
jgi:adenine-specific DNA-methyltransferase